MLEYGFWVEKNTDFLRSSQDTLATTATFCERSSYEELGLSQRSAAPLLQALRVLKRPAG